MFSVPCRAVLTSLTLLLVSAGAVLSVHHEKRSRNDTLSKDAAHLLKQMHDLEAEVENLRQRAGMPKANLAPPERSAVGYMGGQSIPIEAKQVLQTTETRIAALSAELKQRVQPALEQTLTREAARPYGIPLQISTSISSTFGPRTNPFGDSNNEFHDGVDLTGGYGTPIQASAPGVVEAAGWSGGYGNRVIVNHGHGYRTLYGHMSQIGVAQGTQVERGQLIGYIGSTGRSTGPHLHYSVYYLGKAVDPQDYLGTVEQTTP